MQDVTARKNELRAVMRRRRAEMTAAEKEAAGRMILHHVLLLEEYRKCGLLFCYVSAKGEPDTYALIADALSSRKMVAVPFCRQGGIMDFYSIRSFDDLEPGFYGIPQPDTVKCRKIETREGFCIVPGLCFDRTGGRLGYGKGYYDRFLSGFSGKSAGLCYSGCLCAEELPRGIYDRKVDFVITQHQILRPGK